MQHKPNLKADIFLAPEEIPCTLWNSSVRYNIHNIPLSVPILSHTNPVHTHSSCLPWVSVSVVRLSDQPPLCFSPLFNACHLHTHVDLNMDCNSMDKTEHGDQRYRHSALLVNGHHDATCREQTARVTRFFASNSRRNRRVLPAGS